MCTHEGAQRVVNGVEPGQVRSSCRQLRVREAVAVFIMLCASCNVYAGLFILFVGNFWAGIGWYGELLLGGQQDCGEGRVG